MAHTRRGFMKGAAAFGAVAATSPALTRPEPRATGRVWEAPVRLDNTGRKDMSLGLSQWLNEVGRPGDTFRLRRAADRASGVYLVPRGVTIRRPIQLDLNGCRLDSGTGDGSEHAPLYDDHVDTRGNPWPRTRYTLAVVASGCHVHSSRVGARIRGSARTAGFVGDRPVGCAYEARYEAQHGISLRGNGNVIDLSQIAVEFVHGDGVDVVQGSMSNWIIGRKLGEPVRLGQGASIDGDQWVPSRQWLPGIHHTGRHGISTARTSGLLIHGMSIWHNGRAMVDLEPNHANDVVSDVQISETEGGARRLLWIPAAGMRSITDVVIRDNVSYDRILMDTRSENATARHANWTIMRNRGGGVHDSARRDVFELDRVDGLQVIDNHQLVDGTRQGMGINPGSSTGVTISPAEAEQFPVA